MKTLFWSFAVISLIISIIGGIVCYESRMFEPCAYFIIYGSIDLFILGIKLAFSLKWNREGNGFNPFLD